MAHRNETLIYAALAPDNSNQRRDPINPNSQKAPNTGEEKAKPARPSLNVVTKNLGESQDDGKSNLAAMLALTLDDDATLVESSVAAAAIDFHKARSNAVAGLDVRLRYETSLKLFSKHPIAVDTMALVKPKHDAGRKEAQYTVEWNKLGKHFNSLGTGVSQAIDSAKYLAVEAKHTVDISTTVYQQLCRQLKTDSLNEDSKATVEAICVSFITAEIKVPSPPQAAEQPKVIKLCFVATSGLFHADASNNDRNRFLAELEIVLNSQLDFSGHRMVFLKSITSSGYIKFLEAISATLKTPFKTTTCAEMTFHPILAQYYLKYGKQFTITGIVNAAVPILSTRKDRPPAQVGKTLSTWDAEAPAQLTNTSVLLTMHRWICCNECQNKRAPYLTSLAFMQFMGEQAILLEKTPPELLSPFAIDYSEKYNSHDNTIYNEYRLLCRDIETIYADLEAQNKALSEVKDDDVASLQKLQSLCTNLRSKAANYIRIIDDFCKKATKKLPDSSQVSTKITELIAEQARNQKNNLQMVVTQCEQNKAKINTLLEPYRDKMKQLKQREQSALPEDEKTRKQTLKKTAHAKARNAAVLFKAIAGEGAGPAAGPAPRPAEVAPQLAAVQAL